MKIFQFEIFITVARTNSLSQAASLLYLSQPAVSKHIKSMEEYYGTRLLQRTNQGVNLTEAGEIVYEYARRLQEIHSELEKEIDSCLNPEELHLDVGASPTPGEYLLPCTLWTFKEKHPDADVELKVNYSTEIVESVLKEKLLLGVIEGDLPSGSHIKSDHLLTDELKIITAAESEVREIKKISDLVELPLILPSSDFYIRTVFKRLLSKQGLKISDLNVVAEMNSLTAIKSAVESDMGVSLLSYSAVKKPSFQDRIEIVELEEGLEDELELDINLIYSSRPDHPGIITKFISFLTLQHQHSFC